MKSSIPTPLDFRVLEAISTLYARVVASPRPMDREVTAWLRAQRRLERAERDFIAQTVYGMVRQRRRLEATAGEARGEAALLTRIYLLTATHLRPADLPRPDAELERAQRLIAAAASTTPASGVEALALAHSLPDWLAQRLTDAFGADDAAKLAEALRRKPPVTLRANTLHIDRDALQRRLSGEGVRTGPTRYSPVGLTLMGHARAMQTEAFRRGLFEVQDEGSQLLALLVGARPGAVVVDACAGAGGKTLHLAAEMENKGSLYALDAHAWRLDQLHPRARRAGVHNVRAHAVEGKDGRHRLDRLRERADAVLVDAPCSGTGALRRNPDAAWKLQDAEIAAFSALQGELLARYAELVRPGGRLVYATCSLLPDENERVVEAFLAARPDFAPLDAAALLAERGIAPWEHPRGAEPWLRLWPSIQGTDGFFGAALARR